MISPLISTRSMVLRQYLHLRLLVAVAFTSITGVSHSEEKVPPARKDVIQQMKGSDDEAFHAMLYWLPDTEVIFKQNIDTVTSPQWVGYEAQLFKEIPAEKKSALYDSIIQENQKLNDTDWQARYQRMQLWMALYLQQRALLNLYSGDAYYMAAEKVAAFKPLLGRIHEKTLKPGAETKMAGLSTAQMRWARGAYINELMQLSEVERTRAQTQMSLALAAVMKQQKASAAAEKRDAGKPKADRGKIITQMLEANGEAFHVMLFFLPETKTIFGNVIDTKNPAWVGFEPNFFKDVSAEKKNILMQEITAQCVKLDSSAWEKQRRRMQLWMGLYQAQKKLCSAYGVEPYFNAVYTIEKLRPVLAASIESRKRGGMDPAMIGDSVSSAEGRQLEGAVINQMLTLSETERLKAMVDISLHMAQWELQLTGNKRKT